MNPRTALLSLTVSLVIAGAPVHGDDWPMFRGPSAGVGEG
jgi:hypothetical protein